jgi:hypothetical protein
MRIMIAIFISILSLFYLLPTGIAVGRARTNTAAIFALNLFLGWTLVGWVLSLVWSVAHDDLRTRPQGR